MKISKIGYMLGVVAASIVLLWIGVLKFTPAEADGIKQYAENSFILSWLYLIGSVQQVSNVIGVFEIITSILLLLSFGSKKAGVVGGVMALIIFLTTTTFLITTPGIWKVPQGVVITDFFVLKDLAYLALALQVIGKNINEDSINVLKLKNS
jgi:reactive chlorine resistance protein C